MNKPVMTPIPTPPAKRGFDWESVAAICRETPGQWYEIPEAPSTTSPWHIKQGMLVALRPVGEWDAARAGGALRLVYLGT